MIFNFNFSFCHENLSSYKILNEYLGGNKKWKFWLADQGWMGRRVNDKWNKCTMMGMQ